MAKFVGLRPQNKAQRKVYSILGTRSGNGGAEQVHMVNVANVLGAFVPVWLGVRVNLSFGKKKTTTSVNLFLKKVHIRQCVCL